MIHLVLPILLSAISAGSEVRTPTDTELRRAHELLAGSWEFLSITEKGENLGPRLVGLRVARDNILTIGNRQFSIVNPESGEKRTATYRIDPSKSPRQIDLVTSKDRIYRGIYKFDNEDLILCLQPGDTVPRPEEFTAPESSDLLLIRLRAVSAQKSAALAAATNSGRDLPVRDQTPNTGSLLSGHEMLSGSWDIISIVDDGSTLAPDLIKAKFAENGRVQIGTRALAIVSPTAGERRVSPIRIDPSKSPSEIEVTTRFDEVLKGIYQFEGDQLVLCLAKGEDDDRPTVFKAPAGSNAALFRLKMAQSKKESAPPASAPVTAAAATTATPARPAPAQPPVDADRQRDDQIRQKIAGGWSYTDNKGTLTLVFRADGTFSATRAWRSNLKRIFEGDTTSSEGRWSYARGVLDAYITSTQNPLLLTRNYNYRVQSIGDNTLVVKNFVGQLQTARRLR